MNDQDPALNEVGMLLSHPRMNKCRVGRSAEKLVDASTELERVLAIALATTQQIPRSNLRLRPLSDAIIK